jgi:hypothetical protein
VLAIFRPDPLQLIAQEGGRAKPRVSVHSVVLEPERQVLALGIGPAPTSEGPWMRAGDLGGAADEAAAGLAHERTPYARGQLLLWGARAAAAAGDVIQAETWRRELAMLPGEGVAELQAEARSDQRRSAAVWRRKKPHANLFLLDAL